MKRFFIITTLVFFSTGLLFSQPSKQLVNLIETANLIGEKEEDPLVKTVELFQSEIGNFNALEQAIINSMIAECLWSYLQQNRWQIFERTTLTNPDLTDIRTWDARLLLQQTILYYQRSLQPREVLQKRHVRNYKDVLILGDDESEIQRPTMFDLLAHRAINTWMHHDLRLTQALDQFLVDDPRYMLPTNHRMRIAGFTTLEIPTIDTFSLDYQILKTFQLLSQFHAQDNDPNVLIPLDLQRMAWVRNKAVFGNVDNAYREALEMYASFYQNREVTAQIYFTLAEFHNELGNRYNGLISEDFRWDKTAALQYISDLQQKFPNSPFAKAGRALAEQIEMSRISLQKQDILLPNQENLFLMTFTNVDKVNFFLYRLTDADLRSTEFLRDRELFLRKQAQKTTVFRQWETPIQNPHDYQSHRIELPLAALPVGYYVLFASTKKDIASDGLYTDLEAHVFGVSELSFMSNSEDNKLEGIVLNRRTGKPMQGVRIRVFSSNFDWRTREQTNTELAMLTSAKNGRFDYSHSNNNQSVSVELQHKSDVLLSQNESFWLQNNVVRPVENWRRQTFFFTDRAIFRPGQIVYFKGVLVERKGDESRIVTNATTTVRLFDANHREVSSIEVRTNEFGSFSGSFVLPSRGLNGQFSLRNESGTQFFSVEEYKRPTFEITFEPLRNAYRLNEEVIVEGAVKTYSGANLGGSLVKFNVVRSARFPTWRRTWWWRPAEETVIAQGVTLTDENGNFQILFNAISDRRIPANENAIYTFTVTVEATDVSGETQENTQRVLVSKTALNISLNVRPFMDKTKDTILTISSTNLSGQNIPSKGTVKIYRLAPANRLLRERLWDVPNMFSMSKCEFVRRFPNDPFGDENNREKRERTTPVLIADFDTEKCSTLPWKGIFHSPDGDYVWTIETQDVFGNPVKNEGFFTVFSPNSERRTPLQQPFYTMVLNRFVEVGETMSFIIGSATKTDVFYEIRGKNGVIEHKMISLNNEQRRIDFRITEEHRGGLSLQIWSVEGNRNYNTTETISVPFSNKHINISFETFRDVLKPNMQENWTLNLSSNDKKPLQGELLLSMYDASLDVFRKNNWSMSLNTHFWSRSQWTTRNFQVQRSLQIKFISFFSAETPSVNFDRLNFEPPSFWGGRFMPLMRSEIRKSAMNVREDEIEIMADAAEVSGVEIVGYGSARRVGNTVGSAGQMDVLEDEEDMETSQSSDVFSPRTNLNETAFFFPHLRSDENGKIQVSFTVPESMTRWRIQGLAHTKDLKIGIDEWSAITQKNLMISPNMPRFLREGDIIKLQARISNLTNEAISGEAQLKSVMGNWFGPTSAEDTWSKDFSIAPMQNTSVIWAQRFNDAGLLNLTFTAKAGNHTDGEVRMLPVLSNRAMLTETLPMFANARSERKFTFTKLANPNSTTLENHRLTLEIATNPIWFAVQALPELSSPNSQNSIALFGAFFSNAMARDILNRNPEIKTVFNRWKMAGSETLRSKLETNQDLKTVLLDETPWLLQAESEIRKKENIALYFDENNVRNLQEDVFTRLKNLQLPNGGFTWFPGGRGDLWSTQYIVQGLQRLHSRNIERNNFELQNMLQNALRFCDEWHIAWYRDIVRARSARPGTQTMSWHLTPAGVQYLYLRTYFADQHPISPEMAQVLHVCDSLAKATWRTQSRMLQGILALYFDLKGEKKLVDDIMQNFSRLALKSPEFGMWWRVEPSWNWFESPIETQSQLIETFSKLGKKEDVDLMKQWLLTQKRTTSWNTPKASSEAIYALLLGTPNLSENTQVQIQIGNEIITTPNTADAGSGYFTKIWTANEIKSNQSQIIIKNQGNSMVWGGLYWQYFENLDKVTPATTPLSIKKELFVETPTDRGMVLVPLRRDTLKIGDRVTVRIEIRTDRNLDFVHLKDLRAATFEPIEMRSGYQFQDGLFYYQEIKDVSMNFYFSHLSRGTYVFEYSLRVSQIGNFSNGYTTIQCLYAPEFSAQSQGDRVIVN
jgi:uncharacterized protein YfaS (alpha-2-macroglobulin family)